MSRGAGEPAGGVQSVERAVDVLDLLERAGELGVADVAAQLGVHKSTAFRLLATLEQHDLVEVAGQRGRFRLGNGVLRLAAATAVRLDLVQESRAVTRRLAAAVGETVNVVTLAGHHALYLDQAAGAAARPLHNWVGQRIPLHATSNGKVLLAFQSPAHLTDLLQPVLPAYTPRTITDLGRLRRALAEVRRAGYATAVDELEVGLTAVAAPVCDAAGTVVGSLSISGPSRRIGPARLRELAEQVRQAAGEVSRRLGWVDPAAAARA